MTLWDPENIVSALERFPTDKHPLFETDISISNLARYRDWLINCLLYAPLIPLEERVMDLTSDEFQLMEKTALERDPKNQITFNWSTISQDSPWLEILGTNPKKEDDCYAYWRISYASIQPQFPCAVVFIERGSYFNNGEPNFNEYTTPSIAITSKEELTNLFESFTPNNSNTQEDIHTFLEKAPSWEKYLREENNPTPT
ncbi:MAG: hypothetical protein UR69_C0006G0007 [Candidatus Moranbacteria bacterium GW2011_GWE2_35_2-]|nr:MAG: hypothetical protein UR69_C0006G0007 [Candidatus Moranbacteria bacterium GW2011_GWE2_35_2-]